MSAELTVIPTNSTAVWRERNIKIAPKGKGQPNLSFVGINSSSVDA
jgi:hypothetical protein